jgi:hypothetical protein
MPRNRTSAHGFDNPIGHHGLHPVALRTRIELVSFLRQRNCDTSRITKRVRALGSSRTSALQFRKPRPIRGREHWGAAQNRTARRGSQPHLFTKTTAPRVGVAGIEPATSRFQAEMSTNDLHPEGQSGWNRTSMTVLPRHVDNQYPTLCCCVPRARVERASFALQANAVTGSAVEGLRLKRCSPLVSEQQLWGQESNPRKAHEQCAQCAST